MGKSTGISWTDSTQNFWEGCTKVGPGCEHCYAETRDIRYNSKAGVTHWGAGAPRRQMSEHTRHNAWRWEREAAVFRLEHGRDRRVFCSSLSDLFDNEVPADWREDAYFTIGATTGLLWQLLTKRVGNVGKMVPDSWLVEWPKHVGLMITVVTQEEADRDIPKLERLKELHGIPWIGLSVEPMVEMFDLSEHLRRGNIDWVIIGGESGPGARPFHSGWAAFLIGMCYATSTAVFVKQMGNNFWHEGEYQSWDVDDPKRQNMATWPEILRVRQFPKELT